MTQNNGHYTVHGHSRSPILVPIESPYATSIGNNTNLHSISRRFQVIADYVSNLRKRTVRRTIINNFYHIIISVYFLYYFYLFYIILFCSAALSTVQ